MTYDVGVGGSRLTVSQRQRLAIARCLLKKPDIVVLNEALTSIEWGFTEADTRGITQRTFGSNADNDRG